MAELMLAERLADSAISVASAGVAAPEGRVPPRHAVAVMADHGLDLSAHRAVQVTAEMLRAHDLVLTAEWLHVREVVRMEPTVRGRVFRLGHWADMDIPDPIGQPRRDFEHARDLIDWCLDVWVPRLEPAVAARNE